MGLDNIQQLENLLLRSREVLIFAPKNATGDAIGSSWALQYFLEKKNIRSTIVMEKNESKFERFAFLGSPLSLRYDMSGARDFVLSFNTKYNKITDVRSENDDNELRIYITPEKGSIDPRDFSFIPAKFKYDLVVVLDCPDKEALGKTFEDNPDIFYEVPVINIDHHTDNENFGQINVVDITSSSTSEIIAQILEKIDDNLIDERIAQCLLTGIIDATNSFQKKNTTPKALQAAANLMTKGADQQEIVRFLYKTQPFYLLKLWGRIMARLVWEEHLKMVWAPVLLDDFIQSRSNPNDVPFIIEKIRDNYAGGKIFMVVFDEKNGVSRAIIKSTDSDLLKKIAVVLSANCSSDMCEFSENGNALDAGKKIVEKIKAIS